MTQDTLRFPESMTQERYLALKTILEERRHEIKGEMRARMREVDGTKSIAHPEEEIASADAQDEIELQLIGLKTDMLQQIREALIRLEENRYGFCGEYGEEITERRLRALPFAVRCKDCEEAKEVDEQVRLAKQMRGRRNGGLFRGV